MKKDRRGIVTASEQLPHRQPAHGVYDLGSDLGHGDENEPSFSQPRVREREPVRADDRATYEEHVEVEGSGCVSFPGRARARAALLSLDLLTDSEKVARLSPEAHSNGGVEKPRPSFNAVGRFGADRLGLVHARHARHENGAFVERVNRGSEAFETIAQIRPEPKESVAGSHRRDYTMRSRRRTREARPLRTARGTW